MRVPLLLLCAASLMLAVVLGGCFDWDGLLDRCVDAGNCRPPPGGADSGDGGRDGGGQDGGDSGTVGGGDAGDGGLGDARVGDPCSSPQECRTRTCIMSFCVCAPNGPCRDNSDCCLGQSCSLVNLDGGSSCGTDIVPGCSPATSPCGGPSLCCYSCGGGSMCSCSPDGIRCSAQPDCCNPTAMCSLGRYCCQPPAMGCSMNDQCCSRVCHNNVCI